MGKIYRYTLRKYIKAPSTWIILAISIFIATFLGGYLPNSKFNFDSENSTMNYAKMSIIVVAAMTSFLSLFVSVFAGFKSATMFKDEVEDGTFLIMLSKPINRSKILLGKYLALESAIIIFSLITALSFALSEIAFDVGDEVKNIHLYGIKSLKSQVWIVSAVMWGIITLMGFIFSSLGVLLSTKISVGATIGISIGLSVVIPVTSLIQTVTKKEEYKSINSYTSGKTLLNQVQSLASLQKVLPQKQINDLLSQISDLNKETDDPQGIYRLGYSTGDTNDFKNLWPFDINFQIQKLASFASDEVVSDLAKSMSADGKATGRPGYSDISSTEDKSSPFASNSGHEDFEYIIKYLKGHVKKIYNTMGELAKTTWEIAYKSFSPAIMMHANDRYDLSLGFNETLKIFSLNDYSVLNTKAGLEDIWNKDHTYGKAHNALFTPLGYKVYNKVNGVSQEATLPTDLSNEWWVAWYKAAASAHEDYVANSNGDTSYIGNPTYLSVWEAINSMFARNKGLYASDTANYNGRSLSEIVGRDPQGYDYKAQYWTRDFLETYSHLLMKRVGLGNYSGQMQSMAVVINRSLTPLCTIVIGWKNLEEAIKGQDMPDLPSKYTKKKLELMISNPENDEYIAINHKYDYNALRNLLKVAYNHPEKIGQINTKGYVSNYTLLWIYLSLALFMVPLSYVIIRRQDFK